MPAIIDYAPAWLSPTSPAGSFFTSCGSERPTQSNRNAKGRDTSGTLNNTTYHGPTRTLAKRGTEIFATVDNQIRWSNLTSLKDEWQAETRKREKDSGRGGGKRDAQSSEPSGARKERLVRGPGSNTPSDEDAGGAPRPEGYYRILDVPVYGQIKQLIPSPNGVFLAIITPHIIHLAVLPDPSHLSGSDYSPIRLKTYQLGPTTHVIPESPVVSALWHPLGVCDNSGGCIVTTTADAIVRVWEVDRSNHWSFDRPTLAIDLKKLVDGTSLDENFAPSGFGQNKGFSADSFDMEVASACFGGRGYDEENPWAPMTLWIAMRTGDVYALCPLLPSKWKAPLITIPSLTISIVHKLAAIQDDSSESDDEQRTIQQQYEWLKEIDSQEPLPVSERSDLSTGLEVRTRPATPSAIPRLQGPFHFDLGDECDGLDVTDILVIAAKADIDDLRAGEDDAHMLDDIPQGGISGTVICVVTASGRVHICLEMDGVEGQWLPKTSRGAFATPISTPSELLLLESLETVKEKCQRPSSWPTFTEDIHSRYNLFVTSANNVTFMSLSSWVDRLEAELQSPDMAGSAFRIKILCDGPMTERQRIIQVNDQQECHSEQLSESLVIYDYDLGYLLLTHSTFSVHGVIFDLSYPSGFLISKELSPFGSESANGQAPITFSRRTPYQVPTIFNSASPLTSIIEDTVPHGHRHSLKEPVRLSPSTLDLVTATHRVLSAHTHVLERAVSDLFRRCERLQGELQDQLLQLADVAERIKGVSSRNDKDGQKSGKLGTLPALESRMKAAESRQQQLADRYENIRKNILKVGGRPMSEKEKEWVREIDELSVSLGESEQAEPGRLAERLKTAKSLAAELLSELKHAAENSPASQPASQGTASKQPAIPQRLQRAKITDAMKLVERESAVIDAITSRLEKLNTCVFEA